MGFILILASGIIIVGGIVFYYIHNKILNKQEKEFEQEMESLKKENDEYDEWQKIELTPAQAALLQTTGILKLPQFNQPIIIKEIIDKNTN